MKLTYAVALCLITIIGSNQLVSPVVADELSGGCNYGTTYPVDRSLEGAFGMYLDRGMTAISINLGSGQISYWDGGQWKPIKDQSFADFLRNKFNERGKFCVTPPVNLDIAIPVQVSR